MEVPSGKLRSRIGVALIAMFTVLVAGCGAAVAQPKTSSTASSSAHVKFDSKIAALLPSSVRTHGSISVGSEIDYPPFEFIASNGTPVGFDIDLGHAIGEVLGIKFDFVNAQFASIIPSLQSGRYEIGMSAFTDSLVREQVVNFVDYVQAGEVIVVPKGNPLGISGITDLCGRAVAALAGSVAIGVLQTYSQKCVAAGKKAIVVPTFPNQDATNLAVSSGRAAAMDIGAAIAGYLVKTTGHFQVVGGLVDKQLYGIAVPKGSTALEHAIQAALQSLIKSGAYQQLLKKWGMGSFGISRVMINGGGSLPVA